MRALADTLPQFVLIRDKRSKLCLSGVETFGNPVQAMAREATILSGIESTQRDLIPRIIHFCVLPPMLLTPEIERRIQVARELHPGWEIRIWRDAIDPASFRLSRLWKTVNSGAQLCDLIRVEVVQQFGGFYSDVDVDFHRSLEPLRSYGFVVCAEAGHLVGNTFFGAIPHHRALEELVLAYSQLDALPKEVPPDVSTGPDFFTRWLGGRDDVTLMPRELIFPFTMRQAPGKPPPAAFATHLWHGSWLHKRPPLRYRAARAALIAKLDRTVERLLFRYRIGRGAYPADGDLVVRTAHGHQVVISASDVLVAPDLIFTGYYQRQEELFVKQLVNGGDWCVDLGADGAVFSLLFGACVGPFGRVFSFVRDRSAGKYLERSARLSGMTERIAIGELAGGDQVPSRQTRTSKDGSADPVRPGLAPTPNWFSRDLVLTVGERAKLLDAIFPDWAIFACVRIAVVGQELALLRSCRRLLEERRIKCLLIEVRKELDPEAFFSLVAELREIMQFGYTCGAGSNYGDFVPMGFELMVRVLGAKSWIFLRE